MVISARAKPGFSFMMVDFTSDAKIKSKPSEPILKIEKSLFYIQKPQVFEYKKVDLSDF
jgi:hypothetical protein